VVRVGILLIVAALIAGMAGCIATPAVQIRDWYDLDAVRDNLGGSYILMNDLDSTTTGYEELAGPMANGEQGWQPIGLFNPREYDMDGFRGTFDGQGHEIRDLFINRPHEFGVGLFGVVDEGGVVQNIGVVNADVTGNPFVGGLVGFHSGTVNGSYSSGSVTGNYAVGGLVGVNEEGTVSNCYSTGSVTGYSYVGGLVGENTLGTVSNSFWETETSGQAASDGGTGKTTAEMKSIATFSGTGWDIIAVADLGTRNPAYIWNIVDGETYPFLSWQP